MTDTSTPKEGHLLSWGTSQLGSLGLGLKDSEVRPPNIVGERADWVAVASHWQHSLALTSDGQLFGWGNNQSGALGTDVGYAPTPMLLSGRRWAAISVGMNTTFAIDDHGQLFAAGHNAQGQLGLGDTTNRSALTRIGHRDDWRSISAAANRCYALTADGDLYGWGSNYGELGTGDEGNRYEPTQIAPDQTWAKLGGGGNPCMAITQDGALYGWGRNYYAQLGFGGGSDECVLSPTRIEGPTGWTSVATGDDHSLGVADGQLVGAGRNERSSLCTLPHVTPQFVHVDPEATEWREVFAEGWSSFGIDSEHRLHVWGDNNWAKLGIHPEEAPYCPVTLELPMPWGARWIQVTASGFSGLGIAELDGV